VSPRRRPARYPLYDARFEHDACGVGFVADGGGRSAHRVVPLALAGLAALRHRGAVGADGASSDGAGVLLPLTRDLLDRLGHEAEDRPATGTRRRPGVIVAFLPRTRAGTAAGRRAIVGALAGEGLGQPTWRTVPLDVGALGAQAAEHRPLILQAFVDRPAGLSEVAFETTLVLVRRRAEAAAREAGLAGFAIASASSRTVVYKALVSGDRLPQAYPDLAEPIADAPFALFHQRYATNTHPTWPLAQPFRLLAHNGEINTVRGNREQVRGRTADRIVGRVAARLLAAGPLLSPDGSDSLSLDEAVELLVATGWPIATALLALVREAPGLRRTSVPGANRFIGEFAARTAGFLAPWDGPGAFAFTDGRTVGALVDRNGLRPLAYALTADGICAAASEAGAVPLAAAETVRRGRLGPGEMLLVVPGRRVILEDAAAKAMALGRAPGRARPPRQAADVGRGAIHSVPDRPDAGADPMATPVALRFLAGLDAERLRQDIRTMAVEGHEPLWSMGDDTPTPAQGRIDRPVADHLRQAFAQVTNPPIDPERERAVMDLSIELGPRPPILGGPLRLGALGLGLGRPIVADPDRLIARFAGRVRRLDATWDPATGRDGLATALDRLTRRALAASRSGASLVVLDDRRLSLRRLPVPSILAVGAVHASLTAAGRRGRTDVLVVAADALDIHGLAMVLAVGATAVAPWLLFELAAEQDGGHRAAEVLTPEAATANLLAGLESGLRKVLARMGISTIASYVGSALFETVELSPAVVARCFPAAPGWPGRVGFAELADRALRRRDAACRLADMGTAARLPDPGLIRFKADGERHLYAPPIVDAVQSLAAAPAEQASDDAAAVSSGPVASLEAYRLALARPPATVRDGLRLRRVGPPVPLPEVEPAAAIARRFVAAGMSLGALSPEAHEAVTLGIQRAGGAANTGEGGEDPALYGGHLGERRDARIKQVASARFGVTAEYLVRADQLEIKIAQGSKPGEGGQLPGRKATAYIAALRRAQPGQSLISPPPHHDIYSIEDLAQLITDLRTINPTARIGVKLVASRGVGTIATGVAKAGADYIHIAGHAGGTGASPLSSIKHVGAPWELGLAETHQALLRSGLRDRVVIRTDGGLQTGRDVVVAALLGAEEFGFGTALLVAIGCDMARQCHLDTCPTGIATQREDLRAKFSGTPGQVARFATAIAEDVRHELAALGARSVGEIVGEGGRVLRPRPAATLDLRPIVGAPAWSTSTERRQRPAEMLRGPSRPASRVEATLVAALLRGDGPPPEGPIAISTADRSFGARIAGEVARGALEPPLDLEFVGSAGQSFGAFLPTGVTIRLTGQANDYVGKGLSGGTVVVRPEVDLAAPGGALVGNTCLYGATDGRLHVVGRAGMRFAVRNSGAHAVVDGLGAHGCEYMSGGVVIVLGSVGANFGAGMTGGRVYLVDPHGRHREQLHAPSVGAIRLSKAIRERDDGVELVGQFRSLIEAHRAAGSARAAALLQADALPLDDIWLVEPIAPPGAAASSPVAGASAPLPRAIAAADEAVASAI
jgi:glutamate synthase domain-containing protein 2/glutamate synthase domain-containing protein 1/glutamate synthase domain-containing protein 3